MQTEIINLIVGMLIGGILGCVIYSLIVKSGKVDKHQYDSLIEKYNLLNNSYSVETEKANSLTEILTKTEAELRVKASDNIITKELYASKGTELEGVRAQFEEFKIEVLKERELYNDSISTNLNLNRNLATVEANLEALKTAYNTKSEDCNQLKNDLTRKTNDFNEINKQHAQLAANNAALQEKLETQKDEIEKLREKFNTDFENIATKIFDDKSEKFTKLNKDNLENLLKPLGDNIDNFKKKVEEVYDTESKERFALGKEMERLVQANQKISEEANNLTKALTSNAKNQGDWGQIILESILERSGLVKDREYFVQEFLKDEDGNFLVNEEGKKMQPDVIIKYPDNRKMIVDSKVSLTAYNKYSSSTTKEGDALALAEHLKSLKRHIDDLSSKNYQDFAPSLDFVMMFVPVEPAYLIAIHTDQDLWNYAYKKRILLTNPSNLIVALKMIVDLWKKDSQSRNYIDIVERAGKLYDKIWGVVDSLKDLGLNLKGAQKHYNITIGRLSDGNDNVLRQMDKLKELGASAKHILPDADKLLIIDIEKESIGHPED